MLNAGDLVCSDSVVLRSLAFDDYLGSPLIGDLEIEGLINLWHRPPKASPSAALYRRPVQ